MINYFWIRVKTRFQKSQLLYTVDHMEVQTTVNSSNFTYHKLLRKISQDLSWLFLVWNAGKAINLLNLRLYSSIFLLAPVSWIIILIQVVYRKYFRQVFYGGQFLLTNRPIRWPFGELSNSTVGSVKVYTWLISYENSRFSPTVMLSAQICLFDGRFRNILLLISSVLMNFNRK